MFKKIKFIFLYFIFLVCGLFCQDFFIRICIKENINNFDFQIYKNNKLLLKTLTGKVYTLRFNKDQVINVSLLDDKKIKIFKKKYSLPVRIYSEGKIIIDNKIYPSEIEIFLNQNNKLNVVNVLYLETYLYGVLSGEVDFNWTDEMLKVQSIISRTYSVSNFARHKKDGYDLCDSIHCQVYKGLYENNKNFLRIKKAVDSTVGLVIFDKKNNKPIQAYYHAVCGGNTENVINVWPNLKDLYYLRGVKCNNCKNSPYFDWEYKIFFDDFLKLFYNNGYKLEGKLIDVKMVSFTKSGRVKNFKILTNKDAVNISSEELRKIIGYNKIRSSKIKNVELLDDLIVFYGHGWGHGVGLCQWGANYLSTKNYKFDKIIQYYYPGTIIKRLY